MSVEAYFMGGPADGQTWAVECDDPMDPPLVKTFLTAPDLRVLNDVPSTTVAPIEHLYRRQVSQASDGPAWVYVWDEPAGKPGSATHEEAR